MIGTTFLLMFFKNKSLLIDIIFLIHSALLFIRAFNRGFISFIRKICAAVLAMICALILTTYLLKLIALNNLFIVTFNSFIAMIIFLYFILFVVFLRVLPIYARKMLFADLIYAFIYMIIVNFIFLSAVNSALRYTYRYKSKPWAGQILAWNVIPAHVVSNISEKSETRDFRTNSIFIVFLIFVDAMQDTIWNLIIASEYGIKARTWIISSFMKYCGFVDKQLPNNMKTKPLSESALLGDAPVELEEY